MFSFALYQDLKERNVPLPDRDNFKECLLLGKAGLAGKA